MTPTNKEMICALDKDTKMAVAQYLRVSITEEAIKLREQQTINKQIGFDYAEKGDMEKFKEFVIRNQMLNDTIEKILKDVEIDFNFRIFHSERQKEEE